MGGCPGKHNCPEISKIVGVFDFINMDCADEEAYTIDGAVCSR